VPSVAILGIYSIALTNKAHLGALAAKKLERMLRVDGIEGDAQA